MYRFYRFFAERGHAADFMQVISRLPHHMLERLGVLFVPANHR